MSLTIAIVVAVSLTLVVGLGQLIFSSEFSLFGVGAAFLLVSASFSAIDFLQRTGRAKQGPSDDVQPATRE